MLTSSDSGYRTSMLMLTGKRVVTVHCAGTVFLAEADMAAIFLRRALDILAVAGSGLVPLHHIDGLDLLLITPATAVACWYDRRTLADILSADSPDVSPVVSHGAIIDGVCPMAVVLSE